MIEVKRLVFSPFGENTYIVYDTISRDAIVIDPGMMSAKEQHLFDDTVAKLNINLTLIVNTHMHVDHCAGNNYIRTKYNINVSASTEDKFLATRVGQQARQFGLFDADIDDIVEINSNLNDGDIITLGEHKILILTTPGHSPGSISLYIPDAEILFSGDTLFHGSVGRTDLPGGDFDTLVDSIKSKLYTLPSNTVVLPGHEAPTTIGQEQRFNYIVNNR